MSFRNNVFRLMEKEGICAAALEKKADISNGVIGKWNDESLPNLKTVISIADYFHVSIDYLLDRAKEDNADSTAPDEKELLDIYRDVSVEGKAAIMTAARAFAGQVDYRKKESASTTA